MTKGAVLTFVSLTLALCLTGCVTLTFTPDAVNRDAVKGEGEIKTMEYQMGDFTGISILDNMSGSLYYAADESNTVRIEAYENHLGLISVDKEAGSVQIDSEAPFYDAGLGETAGEYPKIYISAPVLEKLLVEGAIHFAEMDEIVSDRFDFDCYGVSGGELKLNVTELDVESDGVAGITLTGAAEKATIESSGVGGIEAFGLATKEADVTVSGVGSIEISCSEKLNATVDGIGSISYRGDPEVTKEIDGLGSVDQED